MTVRHALLPSGALPEARLEAEQGEAAEQRRSLRLAVIGDFPEERWPSMDLVSEMLLSMLQKHHADKVQARSLCPPYRRRLSRFPLLGRSRWALNADRLLNRLHDYPRALRRHLGKFDLFHVCDHSYAHLLHALPAGRAGVFCHDLDLFACLMGLSGQSRPRWFKAMARHILRGLQKASVVFFSTQAVRRQIEQQGLLDPGRLVQAPYGIAPEFVAGQSIDEPGQKPFLLHIGSCIPRKRLDVLLDLFARVRSHAPDLLLLQLGGQWSEEQRRQIDRLGITSQVIQRRGVSRHELADLYRRATLVLLPSDAEGFGLPVIEGLACGSIVIASDLPALREAGGNACLYCPVADVPAWVETVRQLLADPQAAPPRSERLAWARRFSWETHSRVILEAYRRFLP